MSKIKNRGLHQCGAEPFKQQQIGTAGIQEVNVYACLQTFAKSKMEWPEEYGVEKMLPLVSLYDISRLAGNGPREVTGSHLKPCR